MMQYAPLPDRAVLAISGEDARTYLQGLISNDINKVTGTQAVFAALLSPQGRFLFDFFISLHEGKLLLDTDKARLPELVKRLTRYRLRSKVVFEERAELGVSVVWGEGSDQWSVASDQIVYNDPRLPEMGMRIISKEVPVFLLRQGFGGQVAGMTSDYDAHRIALGVPEGSKDLIVDRSILLEYGYDELHGVDFGKGCYVGQEVTARSKHRASLRKFLHIVQGDAELPPKGTPLLAGERDVGMMAGSAGKTGLALVQVAEARNAVSLVSGGVALKANLPSWCNTSFGTQAK